MRKVISSGLCEMLQIKRDRPLCLTKCITWSIMAKYYVMEVLVAVTSLVLGIISVALNLVLPIPIIGQIIYMAIGVIAIVLAVKGKQNEPEKKGMAVAGLVLGIIGTAWAAIALVVCIGILGVGATAATELEGMFETMD